MSKFGMDGKPLRFVQFFMPGRIWLWYSFLEGKTLFDRDPSAMTANSGGSMEGRREPAKSQCGSEGLSAAALYDDQFLQQQIAGFEVDQSSMAFLLLQSWSRTAACLMKTILNDGLWHGT